MYWIIGAIAVLMVLFLIAGKPVRRTMAVVRAAQRAVQQKDWEGAARLCRQSHELAGKLHDSVRTRLQSAIEVEWAVVLYRLGKMTEAEELFRTGFSKSRAAGTFEQQTPACVYWGDLCADEGRHLEAEQHYRTALERDENVGNLANMIFDLQRLGDSLIRQGRRADAEETINRAIALETRVVHEQMIREGKDPAQHAIMSWSLPDLHFCREQYEDARAMYREKVSFWEKSVTRPDNIDLGRLQMRLAFTEARTGHRDAAIEMYSRAESTFAREWCEGHPRVAEARAAKAELMQQAVRM